MQQANATSQANHCALPDSWITKIFGHLEALYGSKFADLWRGTDPAAVRRMWAEKLGGFKDMPEAIKQALDSLDERPFPPTLPEFIHLCRDAARRIGSSLAALPHHMTPEEKAKADDAAGVALAAMKQMAGKDHMDWAKKPRSAMAMSVVFEEARKGRDPRFKEIADWLVREGCATEDGKALFVWDGKGWVRP